MSELQRALEKRRHMEAGKIWASRIRPNIYLGAGRDAQNLERLKEHGVTHILNVADDVANFHEAEGSFVYKNLQVADFGADQGISRVFRQAHDFVASPPPSRAPARHSPRVASGGSAGEDRARQSPPPLPANGDCTSQAEGELGGSVETAERPGDAEENTPSTAELPSSEQATFLIHCANGSNRSATVTLALLMMLEGLSLKQAFDDVKQKRGSINPLKDNRRELVRFEKELGRPPTLWAGEFQGSV